MDGMVGHPDNPRKCVRDTSCTHIDECFAPYIDYGKNMTFDEMSEVNKKFKILRLLFLLSAFNAWMVNVDAMWISALSTNMDAAQMKNLKRLAFFNLTLTFEK